MVQCATCNRPFATYAAYQQHAQAKGHEYRAPLKCDTCNLLYSSQQALKDHYRSTASHPSCTRCTEAFKDQAGLTAHSTAVHHVRCEQCNLTFWREDIERHFKESANHPTCTVCGDGFETDILLRAHTTTAHADARCAPCNRPFRTTGALQNHYRDSPAHPHCAICGIGFENDDACGQHMAQRHPPRRVITSPPPSIHVEVETPQQVTASLSPPPAQQQSMPSSPAQPTEDTVTYDAHQIKSQLDTVSESSRSSVLRTVSEPTLTSASSITGDSLMTRHSDSHAGPSVLSPSPKLAQQDVLLTSNPSSEPKPALSLRSLDLVETESVATPLTGPPIVSPASQQTFEFVTFTGTQQEDARSESSLSMESLHTSEASSETGPPSPRAVSPAHSFRLLPRLNVQSAISLALSEAHLRAVSEVKETAAARPEPLISSVLATPSHTTTGQDFSQIMNSALSAGEQEPLSRPASTLPSPPLSSEGHRLSISSTASVHRASSRIATLTLSDTDATVQNAPISTEPVPPASGTPKGLSWHCRVCLKNPCTEPTATMCGHVFCHSCIIKEIAANMQCPVCKKSMLLRLHVEMV